MSSPQHGFRARQVSIPTQPEWAGGGTSFDIAMDIIEWLGNEQYAFVPYEAPACQAGP
jgi:hypothetical protein